MNETKQDCDSRIDPIAKPYEVVGAGNLVSTIWKTGDENSGWRYRFNIFRMTTRAGRVSQQFFPSDLLHLVKLTQVLAATLAEDGCLPLIQRGVLRRLAFFLDDVLLRPCVLQTSERNAVPTVHEIDALTGIIERLPTGATEDGDLRVARDWLQRAAVAVGDNTRSDSTWAAAGVARHSNCPTSGMSTQATQAASGMHSPESSGEESN